MDLGTMGLIRAAYEKGKEAGRMEREEEVQGWKTIYKEESWEAKCHARQEIAKIEARMIKLERDLAKEKKAPSREKEKREGGRGGK